MLVNENGVPIGIKQHEVRGPHAAFVCFTLQLHTFAFERLLNAPHIVEYLQWLGVGVPTGIKGQNVALKHSFE